MRLLNDERGQSVQVGAAILLAFVVIAITMYQVQVVPDQNAEVEFNHNQEVRQQLTELRNSISNAGTLGQSNAVSVKLGDQYPPRTIFLNPPPIRGALRTQEAGNISLGNVKVQGSYEGSGDPTDLVTGNHTTNRIVYTPHYTEFDYAGVTNIEHSLAFNVFENNATNTLTRQRAVRGDSLTLTVLRGNLSEQGTQPISIDPETISGPTGPISITNDSAGPIQLWMPTKTPSVWNETVGTTFSDGTPDTRVARYDGERILVELDRPQYDLRMALVEVGDGVAETTRYDVSEANSGSGGGSGGGGGAYSVDWTDPSSESENSDTSLSQCDSNHCTWDVGASSDDSLQLNAALNPQFNGINITFAVNDTSVGYVNPSSASSGTDGAVTTNLTAVDTGTIDVLASGNDGSDTIAIEVVNLVSEMTYNDDAVAVDGPDENDNVPGGVEFTISNDLGQEAEITRMVINKTSGQAKSISDGVRPNDQPRRTELYVSADVSDGWNDFNGGVSLPADIDLDADGFDNNGNPTMSQGSSARIYLYEFQKQNGQRIDMSGESFSVTTFYTLADGTTGSETFSIDVP
ncbi:hypothetical protein [Salinarchaeum laminariae]|uniref:hypothetical protein n=1 Tax=Salinarchaeum laminariae TaxID=869888 RepID=UPI0020BF7F3B|nr:hypothetical protein [Salinarchaeum laminariae]